jgi:L-2-hydroxyglutarate oxidase LhgO
VKEGILLMDKVDIIIIGAGILGLAIAERLSSKGKEIVVVEKHDGFGREASSRNSEVIHAGLYYPKDSLKARLCVEGNRMLYSLCEQKGIQYQKTGKIVIAGNDDEVEKVNNLYEQGNANGVEGLRLLSKSEIAKMEPLVNCTAGLYSPETGIFDSHGLMKYLEQTSKSNGVILAYNCEVKGISRGNGNFIVDICDADRELMQLQSHFLVNAAGLFSDRIAEMAGIDIDAADYRLHPCKGEYFSLSNRHKGKLKYLIYPEPTSISLGIHTVCDLNGSVKLGPNAFYVDKIDYDVDLSHQEEFYSGIRRFLPFIEFNDLSPDMAGIRAKLQEEDGEFRDFIIAEESAKGVPGLINLIGIESPGLTSCCAIAERVADTIGNL